jgi:hypothetical protein
MVIEEDVKIQLLEICNNMKICNSNNNNIQIVIIIVIRIHLLIYIKNFQ